ncbi:MAG: transketolase [Clostridia bacterium]|nr:transketolase [Clostridia bacterium]
MDKNLKKELKKIACKIRLGVIKGVYSAKSGHPGGSLSVADIMAYLYFSYLNVKADEPKWEDRDRFVLSKGHCAPALYTALALKGYFPLDEIEKLRKTGEMLQGHPDMKKVPGVDFSTGSLGQGLSGAVGMALAAKLDNKDYRIVAVCGDGEIQEGQIWEAAMFASAKKLSNLVVVVDNNNLQIDGTIEEVNSPYPIAEKFTAFGFNTIEINGHCFEEIAKAFESADMCTDKPTAIIAKTVKGKGVSFMENLASWHGTAPNQEQYELATAELNEALKALEVE